MSILQKYKKYFYLFFIVGVIVYFPIFFNGFVWDDFLFIINNFSSQPLLTQNFLGPSIFNSGSFYRPIPFLYFGALYSLLGQHAFFYHLIQLFLHISTTLLLVVFFLLFFSEEISVFLALVFLVHPINVESVAFISSTTSVLYFLFGIGALLIGTHSRISIKRLLIINLLLFLSILTKETGILFLFLLVAYRYLFKLKGTPILIFSSIATTILYFALRVFVGGVTFSTISYDIPIAQLSLYQRMINIPAIILHYLTTFIYPSNLTIWQLWVIKSITLENFIVPLFLCCSFFISLSILTFFLYKRLDEPKPHSQKSLQVLILFLIWLIIGIGSLLQFFPLDMTVADRWFYFPIVGLLGIIGIGLNILQRSYHLNKKILILAMIIILTLFSLRTFVRTFDWKDNLTLYGRDSKNSSENFRLMDQFAMALYLNGRIQDALGVETRSVSTFPTITNLQNLGILYLETKQYEKAISALTQAIQAYKSLPNSVSLTSSGLRSKANVQLLNAYLKLSFAYYMANQSYNAIKLINDDALNEFPSSPNLYLSLALAEISLNNHQEALKAITKAYELSPNKTNTYIYYRIKNNLPIEPKSLSGK